VARPRILAIDVGTGTQDILILEAGSVIENAVQLIMPSPTALLAERVKQATQDRVDLVLTGVTMGGGPDHWAVEAHLKEGLKVYATPDAARTFDDDLDRVAAMGIRIVDSPTATNGARRSEHLASALSSTPWRWRSSTMARLHRAPATADFASTTCENRSAVASAWRASAFWRRRSQCG
jgi:hypothetical protein